MKTFKFKLITLNGTEIDNKDIEFLKIRSKNGDVGILANHTDYVTALSSGKMEIKFSEDNKKHFYVSGGFLEVRNGMATLLAEDLIDYDSKEKVLNERQAKIEKSIKEKMKEDQDVLGTKKKIQDSLKR